MFANHLHKTEERYFMDAASHLNLTPDQLLTTTRSVRKRLDFSRPVPDEVVRECLAVAVQAPTGGNRQGWQFVVVTDKDKRQALADVYRKGWDTYLNLPINTRGPVGLASDRAATLERVRDSSQYLADHMQDAPVLVIPCIRGRTDNAPVVEQAGQWGSLLPAVWSFMLAARERGLGSAWTTVHLFYEQEAADILGIPFQKYMQAGMFPVAYTQGTDFKPANREPLENILHWNTF